jgi:hypothetical protein
MRGAPETAHHAPNLAHGSHGTSSRVDDSGFRQATSTPNNSAAIRRGIEAGIAGCSS